MAAITEEALNEIVRVLHETRRQVDDLQASAASQAAAIPVGGSSGTSDRSTRLVSVIDSIEHREQGWDLHRER